MFTLEKQTIEKNLAIREYVFIIILTVFSIAAIIASAKIWIAHSGTNSAGLFPTIVSVLMLLCCIGALIGVGKEYHKKGEKATDKPLLTIKILLGTEIPFNTFFMMVFTVLYGVFISVLNFYAATAIFLLGSIIFLYRGRHLLRAFLVSAGTVAAIYVIIDVIFNLKLR